MSRTIESLEGRQYFAVTAVFNPAGGGTLSVNGDANNNAITVSRDAAGKLKVNNGAVAIAGGVATTANTKLITIVGNDGSDTLKIDETNGTMPASVMTGGAGDDTMIGGSQADQFFGGSGKDLAIGNKGSDVAFMGTQDDTFVWNPGDGNDIIEGDEGYDTMQFNGSGGDEIIDVSNNGGRLKFTRNLGNIVMDADNLERVNFAANGGADQITVRNLAGTDVKEVNLDLEPTGGAPAVADTITVHGRDTAETINVTGTGGKVQVSGLAATVNIERAKSVDSLTVRANGGHDKLSAETLTTPIKLTLDGGTGNDDIEGSNLADLLIGGDDNDHVTGNKGDDKALLGAGDDTFDWDPGDGSDSMEGGTGTDLLDFDGANVDEVITISNNAGRLKFFRDVASVNMDANDLERVLFEALGGKDQVIVQNLAGTDVKQVKIDLGAIAGNPNPDGSIDSVTVNGTAQIDSINVTASASGVKVAGLFAEVLIAGASQNDKLQINTLGGNDKVDASLLPAGKIRLRLEGGADNDWLIGSQGGDELFGQDGNDKLEGLAGDDLLNGGAGTDTLLGGSGNNTLVP